MRERSGDPSRTLCQGAMSNNNGFIVSLNNGCIIINNIIYIIFYAIIEINKEKIEKRMN